jgi:hypothetical protein
LNNHAVKWGGVTNAPPIHPARFAPAGPRLRERFPSSLKQPWLSSKLGLIFDKGRLLGYYGTISSIDRAPRGHVSLPRGGDV